MAVAAKPTQDFVPIKEIRDGIVVLADGSFRALLLASSINFALKSDEERQAILIQFQSFLNSLDFSVQIFVQSKKLNIKPYLALLQDRLKDETSELMKIQIQEYIGFVRNFTENTEIMKKGFFVVIPYSPALLQTKSGGGNFISGLSNLFVKKDKNKPAIGQQDIFEENRSQLEERLTVVEQGLTRCGIRMARLGTEEVVELFYKIFNPGDTEKPMQFN